MKTWIIRGAKVVDPSQNLEDTRDILIKDGKIQEIGTNIISENAEIIEANGLIVAPGLVDMHVHLRDPGQTHKETVQTGCQSAAAAGVTSLACMPNTSRHAIRRRLWRRFSAKLRPLRRGCILWRRFPPRSRGGN